MDLSWRRSAVFTSWVTVVVRLGSSFILLSAVSIKLTTAELAVWLTFNVIASLATAFDFGFNPSYVRLLSWAHANDRSHRHDDSTPNVEPLPFSFAQLAATASWTYRRVALLSGPLIASLGSFAIFNITQHSEVATQKSAWLAWLLQIVVFCVTILQSKYIVVLHGSGNMAKQRTYEACVALLGLAVNIIVILSGGGLIALSATALVASVAALALYRRESAAILAPLSTPQNAPAAKEARNAVWAAAWRSGLGIACSLGVAQVALLAFTSTLSAALAARYLLGLQIMQVLSAVSQPPFYSKIPQFVHLYASRRLDELKESARRSMRLSHWVFALSASVVGIAADPILARLGSNVAFPEPIFWGILTVAFFFERFAAMHLQLFTITNRVIWHITNSITGAIIVVCMPVFIASVGPSGFPLAMLMGYAGFSSWYCARLSYRMLGTSAWDFERSSAIPVAAGVALLWLWASLGVHR